MERLARSKAAFGTILFGGVVLFFVILAFLQQLLGVVADKADEIDARRTYRAVEAAAGYARHELLDSVKELAQANDPTATSAPVPDPSELDALWRGLTEPVGPNHGVFLTGPDGTVLWGRVGDMRVAGAAPDVLGPSLLNLVLLLGSSDSGGSISSYVRFDDRPMLAAAARLQNGRALVVLRRLDAAMEAAGHTYQITGLRVAGDFGEGPRYELFDDTGANIGSLSWDPNLPGVEATAAAWPHVRNTLAVVSASIAIFVLISRYGFRRLAEEEQRSRLASLTDGLSGLPNRRALNERLATLLDPSEEDGVPAAVVFIDLDGFKDVNDSYGHGVGDTVIKMLAAGFTTMARDGLIARLGGDEFAAVFCSRKARKEATEFASDVLLFLTQPFVVGDHKIHIGASIGVAVAAPGDCTSTELFRRADVAMYEAKVKGGDRFAVYEAEMDADRNTRQAIEEGIRTGLENDEFDVFYQPIVDARTEAVTAVEALVRWSRRKAGPLPPDSFIGVAESSGLIHQLGLFVLRRACEDLRDVEGITLSVNVSPAQFRDPNFEYNVAEIISEVDFPTKRLELEVTEGYLIEHPERAVAAIGALKRQGIAIALDDFGTGYSSIGYLRRYGFDRIKIDKSLASRVGTDPQATALVGGTVAIATALSMSVTAEGVESAEHALLLKAAGCQKLQGYHYGRPAPITSLKLPRGTANERAA